MDPITHLLVTRIFIGKEPQILLAGLAPDAPFYLTYPAWLVRTGQLRHALRTNDWPAPPTWMATVNHLRIVSWSSLCMPWLFACCGGNGPPPKARRGRCTSSLTFLCTHDGDG